MSPIASDGLMPLATPTSAAPAIESRMSRSPVSPRRPCRRHIDQAIGRSSSHRSALPGRRSPDGRISQEIEQCGPLFRKRANDTKRRREFPHEPAAPTCRRRAGELGRLPLSTMRAAGLFAIRRFAGAPDHRRTSAAGPAVPLGQMIDDKDDRAIGGALRTARTSASPTISDCPVASTM